MNERLEYQQLECYKLANDMQKEKLNREPYFDHKGRKTTF